MKKKLYYFSIALNVILILVCTSILLVKGPSWFINKANAVFATRKPDTRIVADEIGYKNKTQVYAGLTNKENQNKIVFLGDSITAYMEWDEFLQNEKVINRGIPGDTTQGVFNRLEDIIRLKPKTIFLMIGINDLNSLGKKPNEVVKNYDEIVQRLTNELPNTDIYLESVLPIRDTPKSTIKNIKTVNQQIQTISKKYEVSYVDLYPLFEDKQGYLNKKYTTDGGHLSIYGYSVWKNTIQKYIK